MFFKHIFFISAEKLILQILIRSWRCASKTHNLFSWRNKENTGTVQLEKNVP